MFAVPINSIQTSHEDIIKERLMKKRIYTIETISSYIWDTVIYPTLHKNQLKVSTRAIKHIWNDYREVITYLTNSKCMKLSICGQGSFRQGVSTYDFLSPCPKQDYSSFSEYIENKKVRCQKRFLDIDGICFDTAGVSELDVEKIERICEQGIKPKFADLNRRFYHDIISLSKTARNKITFMGQEFVSIDINAAIPRLLPIWLLKRNPDDETMNEIKIWVEHIKNQDAYSGLMNALDICMSRNKFKTYFLPFLFGAGSEDSLCDLIRASFFSKFPNISTLLKQESSKYRFAKMKNVRTWKHGCLANDIFQLEARIINHTLRKLKCKKFSVYDEIYVQKENIELAANLLENSWMKVCGDSDLLAVKIDGELRFAQIGSFVAKAPQSPKNQDWKKSLKRTNEKGGRRYHNSAVLESSSSYAGNSSFRFYFSPLSQPKQE